MKRHGHLFEQIVEYHSLLAASHRARRGKQARIEVARFVFDLERNLLALQAELRSGTYRMRPYRTFVVREPKVRRICAAHFRDRVVHHAVCSVLDPVIEAGMIGDTFACRRGKGTHAAVRRVQDFSRKLPYVLLCDVRKYFETIDQEVLKDRLRRKLKDRALLALLDRIIEHPLPGGKPGKGVPIGNLTSQHFANLYLGELDHFIKDRLGLPGYVRYMDDLAVFAHAKPLLRRTLDSMREFLGARLRLELREERTRITPVTQGVPFLGFRVFPGVMRLDGRKWARLRRRVRAREAAYRLGRISEDDLERSVRSMAAHVSHSDSLQARRELFALSCRLG
ncbi:MAG: reverse transcriptase domain-containing protein [Bryobacterales bacterium]|nr:reverse transcriptase domain-containing protein [Bryobacterales bacterium]